MRDESLIHYEAIGFQAERCFPGSYKALWSFEQANTEPSDSELAAWQEFNIGVQVGHPRGFSILHFQNEDTYRVALNGHAALSSLSTVHNPDGSIAVWFIDNTYSEANLFLPAYQATMIGRNYLTPAPPGNIGQNLCEFIHKSDPVLGVLDPDLTGARSVYIKPFAMQAISLRGLMAFAPPPMLPYVAGGVLDAQGKLIIAGVPKAGKSRLAMNLAFALATGRSFLGFPTMGRPRTLFIQFEVSEARLRERAISIAKAWKIPADSDLPVDFTTLPGLRLDEKAGVSELRKHIQVMQSEVVFLDPMSKIHLSDEREGMDMIAVLNILDDLITELNIGIVLVHHLKKPTADTKGEVWARLRGSSAIPAWTDSMLVLDKASHDAKPMVHAVLRNGEDWTKVIKFKSDHTLEVIGDLRSAIEASIEEEFFLNPSHSKRSLAGKVAQMYNVDIQEVIATITYMVNNGVTLPS